MGAECRSGAVRLVHFFESFWLFINQDFSQGVPSRAKAVNSPAMNRCGFFMVARLTDERSKEIDRTKEREDDDG